MNKLMGGAAILAAAAAMAVPATASAGSTCAGTESAGACVIGDPVSCAYTTIVKGYQYIRPCSEITIYRP